MIARFLAANIDWIGAVLIVLAYVLRDAGILVLSDETYAAAAFAATMIRGTAGRLKSAKEPH